MGTARDGDQLPSGCEVGTLDGSALSALSARGPSAGRAKRVPKRDALGVGPQRTHECPRWNRKPSWIYPWVGGKEEVDRLVRNVHHLGEPQGRLTAPTRYERNHAHLRVPLQEVREGVRNAGARPRAAGVPVLSERVSRAASFDLRGERREDEPEAFIRERRPRGLR
jgi:hypothetical protein